MTEISQAVRDVIAERVRQVAVKGWTPEHDDAEHGHGELARAAGCYAFVAAGTDEVWAARYWPFHRRWWKPAAPRRMLVKAAALLIAEIERWDRRLARAAADGHFPVLTASSSEDTKSLALAQAMNQIVEATHGASKAAGWWVDPKTGTDLSELPFFPYVVATKLMLVVTEIAEGMEGHRKGLMDDKLPHRPMIEVELADAIHRIADLAGALKCDLGGALVEKMAFNRERPDHKPGARMAAGGKAY